MNKYYTPSGQFSPIAFVYFVLVALVVLPLLGGIYAYATWYIPIIYINFIVTIAFGWIAGYVVARVVIQLGKVRNSILAGVFALLAGLIAYYFQWIVWADLAINTTETIGSKRASIAVSNVQMQELLHLLLNPSDLFELIAQINDEGTWGLRGTVVSGILLSVVWLIEFVVILFFTLVEALNQAKKPFSEIANQWFKAQKISALSYIEDTDEFKKELETENYQKIPELTLTDKKQSHSIFTLYSLANEYYLSVTNYLAEQDDKGKVKMTSSDFIQYLRIDNTLYQALKAKNLMQN